jgi:hypothetical protein
MASENWTVAIPSVKEYSAFRVSDGVRTSYSKQSPTGRYARKVRNGNWDRKKPAVLTPSAYDLLHVVTRQPLGEINTINSTTRRLWKGNLGPVTHPNGWIPGSFKANLQNEALIDALTKLKDQKFNAGVAVAEARGTANLASDVMSAISKLRHDFRYKDYRGAYNRFRRQFKSGQTWSEFKREWGDSLTRSQKLSKLPNTWLYYHFGIKPTVADVQSAQEDWWRRHALPGVNSWRTTVMGSAKFVTSKAGENSDVAPTALNLTMEDVQSMRVYLSVYPQNDFLARLAQLGVTNLPEAVWNGVPYSWVVDYFSSFGQWLSVLDAGLGYEFGDTVQSYRRITRWNCRTWGFSPSYGTGSVICTPYSSRSTTLDRDIIKELYPPMFRVRPMVKLGAPTMNRFANMLSVLAGVFSGNGTPQGKT